jgi:hypothetical protein
VRTATATLVVDPCDGDSCPWTSELICQDEDRRLFFILVEAPDLDTVENQL